MPPFIDNNTKTCDSQVLCDRSASGRVRPWALYKLANTYIAYAYDDIDEKKASRLRDCATCLTYRRDGEVLRLVHADFCRVRLCPICQWRRSLKNYGHMLRILGALEGQYSYIFLTLTVRNCAPDALSDTLDNLFESYNRLFKNTNVKKAVKGWYRACEVTHNLDNDTYHPHLHCVVAVNKSYFTSRDYITQGEWSQYWKTALKADYTPVVDVRKIKGNDCKAVAEASKYAVKASDIINYDDWDLTVDTVRVLDKALNGRRFVGYGGVLREMHKALNLDDSDTGDLLDIGQKGDTIASDDVDEITFVWHSGYNQYRRG